MQIEQFVMAYGVEHDRLRAVLPGGFLSLRPVLRINGEIEDGKNACLEFNTPVEKDGVRGWLNIGFRQNVSFCVNGETVCFHTEHLNISFRKVGIAGSCPAEKDNAGCFFLTPEPVFRPSETITENKEFCDCSFEWLFGENSAKGASTGKTLPAFREEIRHIYPGQEFTVQNAAAIPCRQVLGSYTVSFRRLEKIRLKSI